MEDMFLIREVTVDDAAYIHSIIKPYIDHTAISFEATAPPIEELREKIKKISTHYPWLVCEYMGKVIGYAYGNTHRPRPAYNWSVESSIYTDAAFHGGGIGKVLYEAIFAILKLQGYCSVYAGVLSSNAKSCRFHESMGFSEIGIFKHIGYKLGKWHDNKWYELFLDEPNMAPGRIKPMNEIIDSDIYRNIMTSANKKLAALKMNASNLM